MPDEIADAGASGDTTAAVLTGEAAAETAAAEVDAAVESKAAPADGDKPAKAAADAKPVAAKDAKKPDVAADVKAKADVKAEKAPTDAGKAAAEADEEADDAQVWPEEGFPENWRERLINSMSLTGDALKKATDRAKRAASPAELLRSVLSADSKIGEVTKQLEGRVQIPNGKSAEADVKAFHKAWGVPESADKYDLKEAGELSNLDKEMWEQVLPEFHKGHFSQEQINIAAKAQKAVEALAAKRMEDRAKAIDTETEEVLRTEYPGREYKANVELANRYLTDLMGKHMPDQDARTSFLNLKLEDGTRIGSHVPFVRAIVDAARAWAPEGLPDLGEGGNAVDPQTRINEIVKISHSQKPEDKREYQRLQPELQRLIAAQNRRNGAANAGKR